MSSNFRPRVCKNQIVIANYQDQLDQRLECERDPFKELYDNYNILLEEFSECKLELKEQRAMQGRVFQADHYAMVDIDPDFVSKPTSINHNGSFASSSFMGGSGSIADRTGTVVKTIKMEEELMQLREQKTELLMQKSNLYEKLNAEQDKNMKLDAQYKDILAKYNKLVNEHETNVSNMYSHVEEKNDFKDQLDALKAELQVRQDLNDRLTDDNKRLKIDCQMMQDRILEEKTKVIDMMNQAHEVFDTVVHRSGAGTEVVKANGNNSMMFSPDSGFGQEGSNIDFSIKGMDGKNVHLNDYQLVEDYDNIPNQVKHKIVGHNKECTAMSFNPMGDTLATAGGDKYIKFWNFKKMQQVGSLNLKNHTCCAMAYSLDTELFMACTTDHKATLHKVRGGYKQLHQFNCHTDLITSTKFLFSAKQVVTASMDTLVRFWDLNTGEKMRQINTKLKCFDLHMSRSETNFLTGHHDSIKMWNSRTKESIFTLPDAHAEPVCSARFTTDEQYIASTSKDCSLKIWDVRQRKLLHEFCSEKYKIASNNVQLCISPNSQFVICGTKDGHIFYYDLKKGEVEDIQIAQHRTQVVACEWQPRSEESAQMASIDSFGSILIWSV